MKMKVLLFILMINNFYCLIHFIKKHEKTKKIYRSSDSYGFVILDLSQFDEGESIYITYNSYEGKIDNYIYYTFSNNYPRSYNGSLISEYLYAYSDSTTSHKHNKSNGYGGYYIYYTYDYYYYEFLKPSNASYLIMGYDLTYSHAIHLYVDNTFFSRGKAILIWVGSIGGVILIAVCAFLIWKYHHKINCESLTSCGCCDCCNKTHSYDITSTNDYQNKSEQKLNTISSIPSGSEENITTQYEKPIPEPTEKPLTEPISNYIIFLSDLISKINL